MKVVWSHETASHKTTVTHITPSYINDDGHKDPEYYSVGIDCINEDGLHVRATSISTHQEKSVAITHASRLQEIVAWGR